MGANISTLRGIAENITAICNALVSLVDANLVAQGRAIVARMNEFITAFPWYYSTLFAVGAFLYFLPDIIDAVANWIRALRSSCEHFKSIYNNLTVDGSPPSPKGKQIDKKIEELEAENRKLRKLLEENQDYADKNGVQPFNIFIQNNYNTYNVNTNSKESNENTLF